MSFLKMNILSLPEELRPRERLRAYGIKAWSNAELLAKLLAIILQTDNKKENAIELSVHLLKNYDLKSLSRARLAALQKEKGIGLAKACQITACFELGRCLAAFQQLRKVKINSAKGLLKGRLSPSLATAV